MFDSVQLTKDGDEVILKHAFPQTNAIITSYVLMRIFVIESACAYAEVIIL